MATERSGLVLIAYDGTSAADRAVREAGAVFAGRPALVLAVWNEGLGYELAQEPAIAGVTGPTVDVRAAEEVDDVMKERAQQSAQHGARLALDAGFSPVDGLAVADPDRSIPETIVRVAEEQGAQLIVVGAHAKGRLSQVIIGSTSRDVLRHATLPVLVVRETAAS